MHDVIDDQYTHSARRTSERHGRLTRYPSPRANSLWDWHTRFSVLRVARNTAVVYLCRYLPYLRWKNRLYRHLGMRVGDRVSFALSATVDVFFPQLISVDDNTIVGYHTVILAHEFLRSELRTGPVVIGKDVVIGANCTILPGVVIGDGAVVSSHSLINKDVPPGSVVGGVPAAPINGIGA